MANSKRLTNEVALFSGRFVPPHLGHFATILDLLKRYSKVIVPILDYKERNSVCPARVAKIIMDYFFDVTLSPIIRNRVNVIINRSHFGKITKAQIKREVPRFDVYIAGNMAVLKHMKKLGYKSRFQPRGPILLKKKLPGINFDVIYSGTELRKFVKK